MENTDTTKGIKVGEQRVLRKKFEKNIVRYFSIIAVFYHLYAAQFGAPEVLKYRSTHVALFLSLTFLLYRFNKSSPHDTIPWYDYVLAILAILPTIYIFIEYNYLTTRYPYVSLLKSLDYFFGIILIVLTIEACRRCVSIPLAVLFIFFVGQSLLGNILPPPLTQTPIKFRILIDHLFMTTSGIFGLITGMSATFILMFVLFGSIFEEAKGSEFFMNIATALLGKTRGGTAKTAIIASALFGTISGSAVANVYATGCVTIPLMKKSGFSPEFAGAVEAVASSSGQLVPPIMGAAAFLIADFLNIPYIEVVKAAIFPAFLYLFSLYMNVHIEAEKKQLSVTPLSLYEEAKRNILPYIHLAIPIFIIVILLMRRKTPFFSAYWGVLATFAFAEIRSSTRINLKKLMDSFEKTARRLISIAIALYTANLIVGVIELTGLGLRITSGILFFSKGNLVLTLFLVMISSLILGMGLPTTAAYLIVAIFAAPALIRIGVYPLAAHIYVFYYAILSEITPPVALAAYAGAILAEAPMQKTAIKAVLLGAVVFIMPWVFIYNPELIHHQGSKVFLLRGYISATMGVIPFVSGLQGYLMKKSGLLERVVGLTSGILLFATGLITDILGLFLFITLLAYQWFIIKTHSIKNS